MIRQLQESYALIILCSVLDINRSSFKYWDKHTTAIKPEEVKLAAKVKAAHTLSEGSAGARTRHDSIKQRYGGESLSCC